MFVPDISCQVPMIGLGGAGFSPQAASKQVNEIAMRAMFLIFIIEGYNVYRNDKKIINKSTLYAELIVSRSGKQMS